MTVCTCGALLEDDELVAEPDGDGLGAEVMLAEGELADPSGAVVADGELAAVLAAESSALVMADMTMTPI